VKRVGSVVLRPVRSGADFSAHDVIYLRYNCVVSGSVAQEVCYKSTDVVLILLLDSAIPCPPRACNTFIQIVTVDAKGSSHVRITMRLACAEACDLYGMCRCTPHHRVLAL
jgi:hypothetical protein